MKINELFRKVRKDNNLTQEDLANIINVSRSSIALYEKGIRKPDIHVIKMICKKYNIDINNIEIINKNTGKHYLTISMVMLLLAFVLGACKAIEINEKYGYNIYNDKLKVQNSSEICIIRIDSQECVDNTYKYDVTYISNIYNKKMDITNIKIIFSNKKLYLNTYYLFLEGNIYFEKTISYNECELIHSPFLVRLKDYDCSINYDEQTGECKRVIDYYLDLINDI